MSTNTSENRLWSRIEVDSMIEIEFEGRQRERAKLDNLSKNGACLWTSRELSVGSKLRCFADPSESGIIEFNATVVRLESSKRGSLFGYGCVIDAVKLPD